MRLIGRGDDDTDPGWPGTSGYDDVFGDQTQVDVDDLFADRPWPVRPGATAGSARRRRTAGNGRRLRRRAAALATMAAAFTGLQMWIGTPPDDQDTTEEDIASPDSPTEPPADDPCNPAASRAAGQGTPTDEIEVDVDGDGCPDVVHVEAGVVEVAGERWAIGQPDDRIAFGDWDCDGVATPALYRPDSGDVFVFPAWAESGQPLTVEPVAQVEGGEALTAAPGDGIGGTCDAPVVELATGAQHTIEVTP